MKWITIAYNMIWLRCHPAWQDEHGRPLYPSWIACYETAKIIASVK